MVDTKLVYLYMNPTFLDKLTNSTTNTLPQSQTNKKYQYNATTNKTTITTPKSYLHFSLIVILLYDIKFELLIIC